MRVINAPPPMFAAIDAKFGIAGKPVIFSWGNRIYNPAGFRISTELHAHEAVHCRRQGTTEADIERWWGHYIEDAQFRLDEELPAHRAEYWTFCRRHGNTNQRNTYLSDVAARLSGPLYGEMLTAADARRAILGARL